MPTAEAAGRLPKVAILGGGVAGMTTAFELSQPGWDEKYDSITVYQYGWRLGGKGASGRGAHGRIEEHGLHIWLGFYENAFRMMRECYEELDRGPSLPIRSVEEAFERASLFIVQEPRGDGWVPWFAPFSESDEVPGVEPVSPPSLWTFVLKGLRLALTYDKSARLTPEQMAPAPGVWLYPSGAAAERSGVSLAPAAQAPLNVLASRVEHVYGKLRSLISDVTQLALAGALVLAEQLPADVSDHDPADHELLRRLVDRAVDELRDLRAHPDNESDQARREWYVSDIILGAIRGILADGVLRHAGGLDAIDHYDFSDWLIRHGVSPESARCGMVTTLLYDLPFAYEDGDPRKPAIGAGTALRGAIRTLFTYRGAIAWKMRAGMGDIVFAPMYQVLKDRGVRFEFFHRVEALHLDADGDRVTSIDVSRQATLTDPEAGYSPLCDVKGLPCWPSAPLNDQLVDSLTAEDAESFWSTAEPVERLVLRDGIDFDTVVLAIPVGAHPYICAELIARSARWQTMVEKLGTIYTQAFQLWLNADMDALGCHWPQATTGGYLEPFDTYADMRQLIEREDWDDDTVRSIAYFCNVMPTPPGVPSRDDHELPKRHADQARENALTFLREAIAPLWPGAVHRYPTAFRWELLVDDRDGNGEKRFDTQFWRANVDPSERYVLSLPGTSQYRLAPDESGFENLVLAGDWTRCGLNSGCVEAAVMSGLLAATAVEGPASQRPILWSRDQGANHVF